MFDLGGVLLSPAQLTQLLALLSPGGGKPPEEEPLGRNNIGRALRWNESSQKFDVSVDGITIRTGGQHGTSYLTLGPNSVKAEHLANDINAVVKRFNADRVDDYHVQDFFKYLNTYENRIRVTSVTGGAHNALFGDYGDINSAIAYSNNNGGGFSIEIVGGTHEITTAITEDVIFDIRGAVAMDNIEISAGKSLVIKGLGFFAADIVDVAGRLSINNLPSVTVTSLLHSNADAFTSISGAVVSLSSIVGSGGRMTVDADRLTVGGFSIDGLACDITTGDSFELASESSVTSGSRLTMTARNRMPLEHADVMAVAGDDTTVILRNFTDLAAAATLFQLQPCPLFDDFANTDGLTGPFVYYADSPTMSADGRLTLGGNAIYAPGFIYCGRTGGAFLPPDSDWSVEAVVTRCDYIANNKRAGICAVPGDMTNYIDFNSTGKASCHVFSLGSLVRVYGNGSSWKCVTLASEPSRDDPVTVKIEHTLPGGTHTFKFYYKRPSVDGGNWQLIHTDVPSSYDWTQSWDAGPHAGLTGAGVEYDVEFDSMSADGAYGATPPPRIEIHDCTIKPANNEALAGVSGVDVELILKNSEYDGSAGAGARLINGDDATVTLLKLNESNFTGHASGKLVDGAVFSFNSGSSGVDGCVFDTFAQIFDGTFSWDAVNVPFVLRNRLVDVASGDNIIDLNEHGVSTDMTDILPSAPPADYTRQAHAALLRDIQNARTCSWAVTDALEITIHYGYVRKGDTGGIVTFGLTGSPLYQPIVVDASTVGVNGADAVPLDAEADYFVYVLDDGSAVGGYLSKEFHLSSLPGEMTSAAMVGWVRTDAAGNILPFARYLIKQEIEALVAADLHVINDPVRHQGVGGAIEDNLVSFDNQGLPKDSGVAIGYVGSPAVPQDGEVLVYNAALGRWVNSEIDGGGA